MLLFFVGLYAYEKLIQRYDPGLRLSWTYEKADIAIERQAKRRHLKVVK
jgi:hypothetical protein